jgi:hypothetical protein
MSDFWWTKCLTLPPPPPIVLRFSPVSNFPPKHHSQHRHLYSSLLLEGQMGETWDPSVKHGPPERLGTLDSRVLPLCLYVKCSKSTQCFQTVTSV